MLKARGILPQRTVKEVLALLAIVAVPGVLVGYGVYLGGIELRRRLRERDEEEQAARLQGALRAYPSGTL